MSARSFGLTALEHPPPSIQSFTRSAELGVIPSGGPAINRRVIQAICSAEAGPVLTDLPCFETPAAPAVVGVAYRFRYAFGFRLVESLMLSDVAREAGARKDALP